MRAHPTTTLGRTFVIVWVVLASATAAFLWTAPTATATTYVRGLITTDTTWGISDTMYVATYHVTVRAPATLTILPGTTVKFDPGVHLFIEGSLVADGTASDAQIAGNAINGTGLGIQIEQPSAPTISGNTITNVSGVFAVGILVNAGATAAIDGNTITGVRGANGGNGLSPGAPGRDGAFAVGIYVTAAPSASITTNTVDTAIGGRGGDGQASPGGTGGRGGNGGSAAGIVVWMTSGVYVSGETITKLPGGAGGKGGGGASA